MTEKTRTPNWSAPTRCVVFRFDRMEHGFGQTNRFNPPEKISCGSFLKRMTSHLPPLVPGPNRKTSTRPVALSVAARWNRGDQTESSSRVPPSFESREIWLPPFRETERENWSPISARCKMALGTNNDNKGEKVKNITINNGSIEVATAGFIRGRKRLRQCVMWFLMSHRMHWKPVEKFLFLNQRMGPHLASSLSHVMLTRYLISRETSLPVCARQ